MIPYSLADDLGPYKSEICAFAWLSGIISLAGDFSLAAAASICAFALVVHLDAHYKEPQEVINT